MDQDDIHRRHPINIQIDPCRPDPKQKQLETIKDQTVHILEDRWFFRNLLGRQPRISRCNSDPCPSSSSSSSSSAAAPPPPPPPYTKKEETSCFSMLRPSRLGDEKTNMICRGHGNHGLHRTPSLPVTFRREGSGVVEEEEDDDPPRMADLIMQAMPMPRSSSSSSSRSTLARAPSLPPAGQKKNPPAGIGRLTRRATIHSSKPIRRMATMDSSTPLPSPRRSSNFKDMKQAKLEPSPNFSNCDVADGLKPRNLHRSKSLMSTHELEIEELQGFKDLGFSFDKKEDVCPSVAAGIIPGLNKEFRDGDDQTKSDDKVRRPYLSEAWENQSWSPPVVPKWAVDRNKKKKKSSSSEDMKAQIKFWARSVASNVRQPRMLEPINYAWGEKNETSLSVHDSR